MNDPIAYFITWTTYGTWQPGDPRGWTQRGHATVHPPNPELEDRARHLMTDDQVILTLDQRAIVYTVIVKHCEFRKWPLHARNVRTNHIHVVMTAQIDPKVVREQLKAWSSRRLTEHAGLAGRDRNGHAVGGPRRAISS